MLLLLLLLRYAAGPIGLLVLTQRGLFTIDYLCSCIFCAILGLTVSESRLKVQCKVDILQKMQLLLIRLFYVVTIFTTIYTNCYAMM